MPTCGDAARTGAGILLSVLRVMKQRKVCQVTINYWLYFFFIDNLQC